MANLEKLYDNNFVVTDEDSLFLDPEAHDQLTAVGKTFSGKLSTWEAY